MLWINWKGVSVAGVYFVPASSPFAKRNAKRMIELQQRILEASGKVVILTDANAWIGEIPSVITHHEEGLEKSIQTYPRTSEKKETNPQGEWFLSSMNNVDMIVLNGLKSMALCTYDHPGKEAKSIVDFVVVNQQAFKVVSDLSYVDCRESLCTDHILVSVQVEYDSKARKRKTPRRKKRRKGQMKYLRTVKQKDPFWESLAEECDRSLEDFATILGQTPTEDYAAFKAKLASAISIAWKNSKPMRTCLKATLKSDSVIVELRVKKSNLFRAVKIEKDPERRKALKDEFRQVNKKLKQRTRQAICKYQREKVAEIENLEPDECKRMWQELKNLSGWKSKVTMPEAVFDESKQVVFGERVSEVWRDTFRALGSEDEKNDNFDINFRKEVINNQELIYDESFEPTNACDELDGPLELQEVTEAIARLKLGKAPGHDGIVAEVLKKGGDQVTNAVFALCSKVWRTEILPTDWTRGIIFPILKDGDERDTSNYRGITLLSIVGKVYAHVINARLMSWCEKHDILVEEQGGFRPHRGCPDQLFSLVEILQNRREQGTYCCFIDVKKAFDRVFRAGLWKRIADVGIKGKMWRVLNSFYSTVESCVRVDGFLTDWFRLDTGVRQGCVLSPLLYALFINGLVKELNSMNQGVKVGLRVKRLGTLLYADDIVLLAEDAQSLQRMLDSYELCEKVSSIQRRVKWLCLPRNNPQEL